MTSTINKLPEYFVIYIQPYLSTEFCCYLIRFYIYISNLFTNESNNILNQIHTDRNKRQELPVTENVDTTNKQLYGNESNFFISHLGNNLKYSSCEWPNCLNEPTKENLTKAEDFTISIYQKKLELEGLADDSSILELGCGWGSLTLANAKKYPKLNFVSFCNSENQIQYIKEQIKKNDLKNVSVFVEDYAVFTQGSKSQIYAYKCESFDRIVAIETLEHAQNIKILLQAISLYLKPNGKFFCQSLLHQEKSFVMDNTSWLGRNFYTSGSIISLNSYFHLTPKELYIEDITPVNGTHYCKTLKTWLVLMEKNKEQIINIYGSNFYEKFRMFYMSCSEAFRSGCGTQYLCAYYTFKKT